MEAIVMYTVDFENVSGENETRQFATLTEADDFVMSTNMMGLGAKVRIPVGRVAIQQALHVIGLSYRAIAGIVGVNHRTVWQHIKAADGSNVRHWNRRPQAERVVALAFARKMALSAAINEG
jgi:hypothetical protein